MSTYLRNNKTNNQDSVIQIGSEAWDLDEQLDELLIWLKQHHDFDFASGEWIVDIGFEPRSGTSVAGYTICVELMHLLSVNRITLWLSDYLNARH